MQTTDDPRLAIVRCLVELLSLQGIVHCHWKSNEHLAAAVRGDTDLDILFDERSSVATVRALKESGFTRYLPVWYRRYPHIEDYLGVDAESGKLVHVHAHFRLVLGETGVKSFRLPWEDEVLASRVWDEPMGIHRSEPSRELLLLLVREALKLEPSREAANSRLSRAGTEASGSDREMAWLRERTSEADLLRVAEALIGGESVPAVRRLWSEGLNPGGLTELKGTARRFLEAHRKSGVMRSFVLRQAQTLGPALARATRKLGILDLPSRRIPVGGGAIVAVLGTDGSGKSTLTATLRQRLGAKIDVLGLYMGSAENQADGLRSWLLRARHAFGRGAPPGRDSVRRAKAPWWVTLARDAEHVFWALVLAFDKRRRLRRASRARRRGLLVVCDRYPQVTVEGYNDGPLLGTGSRFAPLRWCGRLERSLYGLAAVHAPDLVIRLVGSGSALASRRPEMNLAQIVRKQDGIRQLRFPASTTVMDIDADHPADRVAALAMTAVGNLLRSRPASR